MVDRSKRGTLQLITGTGGAIVGGRALIGSLLHAKDPARNPATVSVIAEQGDIPCHQTDYSTSGSFHIQIITGKNAIEDTVIFTNDSATDVLIKRFFPGLVTQNEQMLNLNSLLMNRHLILKSGYPYATMTAKWEPLSLDAIHSYLWCDTAISRLPGSDTGIITLHARINNGHAMLTAIHEKILLS